MAETLATTLMQRLAAPFPAAEVRQFKKEWTTRSGEKKSAGPFDFIEDETVMDRLDETLGVGNWYIHVQPISDLAVRVVLGARFDGLAPFVEYEDFGYATRAESAEPLKEAVSDGIRRCGRYLGIARYLYRKHDAADVAQATATAERTKAAQNDGLIGSIEATDKVTSDYQIRYDPEGVPHVGFRLRDGRSGMLVEASSDIAEDLMVLRDTLIGQRVTIWGRVEPRSFAKAGGKPITYQAVVLDRLTGPDGLALPVNRDAPSVPMFDPEAERELDAIA